MNLEPGEAFGNAGYYAIRPSPGKGNGAFALKNIKAGTRILVDQALFVTERPMPYVNEGDVQRIFANLSPPAKAQFLALPLNALNRNAPDASLSAKFYSNMFHIRGQPREGCFGHASRFNHSCAPNCAITTNGQWQQQQCLTIRDVSVGEDLTFSYTEDFLLMTTQERMEDLAMGGFSCGCTLCTQPAEDRVVSDLRRMLMRHMAFLWRGHDSRSAIPQVGAEYVHRHREYIEQQRPIGDTLPMILFAKLAEAEGIINRLPQLAYGHAIAVVLDHAQANGFRRVPWSALLNIREWSRKARMIQRLHTGTETYNHDPTEQRFRWLCDRADRISLSGTLEAHLIRHH
ncbi:uncharacterized protein MYCGRDRAFT_93271 [Zymoseptoria tritici IPO323]|uniref:SET domain-containing protein n=1 Tax=Zymoseptoria tritici (strain CBS 115943 / IPO323) TaxID=336722 RepID=F9XCK6_ZYMTI|nr:uncharacterized protein MYCGRDRAFT_93271 [Zymoseptoria tritici IPO323]EGP87576.1 hypothetical protein MYCGRDRAFT_93271 [Zymoseptoria tritici IPO323]